MHYLYLAIAIVFEVIATSAIKSSAEFTKLWPSLIVIIGYAATFYFFSLSIRVISVGIAYAIWAGLGVILVAAISAVIFKQVPDLPAILGMAMIVCGVVVIQLFSNTVNH